MVVNDLYYCTTVQTSRLMQWYFPDGSQVHHPDTVPYFSTIGMICHGKIVPLKKMFPVEQNCWNTDPPGAIFPEKGDLHVEN